MAAVAASSSRLRCVLVLASVAAAYPAAAEAGKRYRVGGPDGWIVPPPEEMELYYVQWASSIAFYVGDSIEFEYKNDSVIKVSKAGYYHCNEKAGIDDGDVPVPGDGVRVFSLYVPGFAYFASADLGHCNKGQRLMINVLAAEPPAPSPASSSMPALSTSPAPSMAYATGAGSAFAAASFASVLAAAAMAMAG